MALVDQPPADLAGDLRLGSTDQPPGRDRVHGAVRGGSGQGQQPRLVGVLDLAQVAHDGARGLEPPAGQDRRQREHVHSPESVREADRLPGSGARGQ